MLVRKIRCKDAGRTIGEPTPGIIVLSYHEEKSDEHSESLSQIKQSVQKLLIFKFSIIPRSLLVMGIRAFGKFGDKSILDVVTSVQAD